MNEHQTCTLPLVYFMTYLLAGVGSAAYIAEWMFPGRVPLRVFYQLVMTTSNVLAALGADLFFHGQEDTVSWVSMTPTMFSTKSIIWAPL